jgi:hypothetical protein
VDESTGQGRVPLAGSGIGGGVNCFRDTTGPPVRPRGRPPPVPVGRE